MSDWPEEVPILSAMNIVRRSYGVAHSSKHCLMGWVARVFPFDVRMRVRDFLVEECGSNPMLFNDSPRNSKTKVAGVWNRTMAKLGYRQPAGTYKGPK